ncbi:MAG TPA: hypothetical protein PLB41_07025 [Rubrivivax sp.]|nr:hypothetical protein [Rubrivivax sp.]HPO19906.1 hypothetical protein [Rubrivivax sp.]
MKLTTGTVVEGKVVLQGAPLREGAIVTVLAREGDETFEISTELEAELDLALDEATGGQTIGADEVLRRLRKPK